MIEYTSVIWDPYTKANSDRLEIIQRQAACQAYSLYLPKTNVISVLTKLQWQPVQEGRQILRLVFMYKILNCKVAVLADYIEIRF